MKLHPKHNILHFIDFDTHKFIVTPLHREFIKRGHNSQIIYSRNTPQTLPKNIDLLVVCQHWWRIMPDIIKHYKKAGTKILELEHGAPMIYNKNKSYRNTMKLIDIYICWGNNDYNIDLNLFRSPAHKLRIGGTPLYDRPFSSKSCNGILLIDTHGPQHKEVIALSSTIHAYCSSKNIPCFVKIHPVNKESGKCFNNIFHGIKIIDGYTHIVDSMLDVNTVITPISASLITAGLMGKNVVVIADIEKSLKDETSRFISDNKLTSVSHGESIDKAVKTASSFDPSQYISFRGESSKIICDIAEKELL